MTNYPKPGALLQYMLARELYGLAMVYQSGNEPGLVPNIPLSEALGRLSILVKDTDPALFIELESKWLPFNRVSSSLHHYWRGLDASICPANLEQLIADLRRIEVGPDNAGASPR